LLVLGVLQQGVLHLDGVQRAHLHAADPHVGSEAAHSKMKARE
jgi:hypothetical protein